MLCLYLCPQHWSLVLLTPRFCSCPACPELSWLVPATPSSSTLRRHLYSSWPRMKFARWLMHLPPKFRLFPASFIFKKIIFNDPFCPPVQQMFLAPMGASPCGRNSISFCTSPALFQQAHNKAVEAPLTVNLHSPPRSSLLSKQVGSSPSSRQHLMEARPLTPAPTVATRLAMLSCVGTMKQNLLFTSESPTPSLAALAN